MDTKSPPVTILGAGLAGLTAAWHLSHRGIPVRVIEQDSQVGGMARTVEKDGFRFDYGPHRFYSHDPVIIELFNTLASGEIMVHNRQSRVRLKGSYLDYPPSLPNLIRNLRLSTGMRCLLDYVYATSRRRILKGSEPDFQSWVINRFGRRVYEINFESYTQKVWGVPPENLSAELARRRVSAPNLGDVMLRLIFPHHRGNKPYVTSFWYPKSGIGRLAERMAEDIRQRGGEIWLNQSVEALHLSARQVVQLELSQRNGKVDIPCKWVLSTIPLPRLVQRLNPPPDVEIQQAAMLPYRALIYVFLMLDRPAIGKDHWLYFPEERFLFNRVSEPKTFSPTHAPPGKTSLCVEITCTEGDSVWRLPIDTLTGRVVQDLSTAGLIQPADVEGYFSHRSQWGYPVYEVGYERHLGLLLDTIDGITNLFTFGRNGGFDYGNMSEAMASGLAAAETISAAE
jgi:protoporphyrinogen oxidase